MSAMVVTRDHFIDDVFLGGGTFHFDMASSETPHVMVFMRVLIDANDPQDVAEVNTIQDAMTIDAAALQPFLLPDYEEESFEGLLRAILGLGPYVPDSTHMFGA